MQGDYWGHLGIVREWRGLSGEQDSWSCGWNPENMR